MSYRHRPGKPRRRGLFGRLFSSLEGIASSVFAARMLPWIGGRAFSVSSELHDSKDEEDSLLRGEAIHGLPEANITPEQRREALRKYSRYRQEEKQIDG